MWRNTLAGMAVLVVLVAGLPAQVIAQDEPPDEEAPERELVMLLDGSGSISAVDWQIQKDGLEAMLADELLVPRDGSLTFGVVQWAGGATRVEIPLTVIDSTATVNALMQSVDAMAQMGGGTNSGDGVRAGTDLLVAEGHPDSDWLLCMSTDGVTNQGESLGSAVPHAQESGIDRYAVIGIQDGTSFTHQTAISHYGPHVFGGGQVSFVRTSAEYSQLVGGTCLNPPLDVIAVEVNQSVQDWQLSVPLVAGKQTIVRVHLETPDGEPVATSGLLYGTRNGQDLPFSPRGPINLDGKAVIEGDAVERRALRDASLNFRLPRSWLDGDVELRVELPGGQNCLEVAPPAETCSVESSFQATSQLALRSVAVPWETGGGMLRRPTDSQLREQGFRMRSVFPVSDVVTTLGDMLDPFDGSPDLTDVNSALSTAREDECELGCDEDEYWYGLIDGPGGGRAAGIPSMVSSGFLSGTGARLDEAAARNRGPHEVAHSLGIHHIVHSELGLRGNFLWWGGNKQGYCTEVAARSAPDHPHVHEISGVTVPTLGPIGDLQTEVWGIDSRFAGWSIRTDPDEPAPQERLAVSNPYEALPLMSYGNIRVQDNPCILTDEGQMRWISEPTYRTLVTTFGGDGSAGASSTATTFDAAEGTWDALVISGVIDLGEETAEFNSARVLPSERIDFDSEGDFSLDLFGADGQLLTTVDFDPSVMMPDEHEGDEDDHDELFALFRVPVQLPAERVHRVAVRFDDLQLGEKVGSPGVPEVTVTAPGADDVLDGDTVTLAWSGEDPDGDELTYSAFYSPDGSSWRIVAHDTPRTQVEVHRDQLAGSSTGRIVVIASDGLNSSHAFSELFTVVDNAPTITIDEPVDGQHFSAGQPVFLLASAVDTEGGALTGSSIVWTSSLDGHLGTGEEVVLTAADLAEGRHTVTATATDSAGNTASDSVTIDIFRVAPIGDFAPRPAKASVVERLAALDPAPTEWIAHRIARAQSALQPSLADQYWIDDRTLSPLGEDVFKAARSAVDDLDAAVEALLETGATAMASDLLDMIEVLVEADRTLATEAVDAAEAAGADSGTIAQARARLDAAEEYAQQGWWMRAVDEFRKAWKAVS